MSIVWTIVTSATFKLGLILAALAVMVRYKVGIGRVLMASPLLAAVLFASRDLPGAFADEVTREDASFLVKTATLIALIALINFFGALLKETEKLPRLMAALLRLFKDTRVALAGMPMLIGLLPMPGGALLSAPMVEEVADAAEPEVSAENRALVNYLFRHTWEYFLPVYPAILMSVIIWGVSMSDIIARQLVLSFAAVAGALVFILRPIGPLRTKARPADEPAAGAPSRPGVGAIVTGVLPIAAVFGLWDALRALGTDGSPVLGAAGLIAWSQWGRVSLVVALLAVSAAVILHSGVRRRWVWEHVKTCLPFDMFLLMLGAMLFQAVTKSSGAVAAYGEGNRLVGGLAWELQQLQIPLALVLFVIPFVTGLLSGIAVFYVTVSFPILTGLIAVGGTYDGAATVLAFASGYAGVLLSPIHLCLLLTVQHFKANMGAVYRRLIAPAGFTVAVAFVLYFTSTRL
jgi:hypothetical protein